MYLHRSVIAIPRSFSTAPQYPMNTWPELVQMANLCTPAGAPTTCNGTQLDAIAAFLAQF